MILKRKELDLKTKIAGCIMLIGILGFMMSSAMVSHCISKFPTSSTCSIIAQQCIEGVDYSEKVVMWTQIAVISLGVIAVGYFSLFFGRREKL